MIAEDVKKQLHDQLRLAREALVWKLDGLSEYDVRRPLTATGTNLLGLIKHTATWEARYFGEVFGRPFPEMTQRWQDSDGSDLWVTAHESRERILDFAHRVWSHADATIEELPLEAPGQVPWWPRPDVHLFSVMLHVLGDTIRHAGHADIVREQLDGQTGVAAGQSVPIDSKAALDPDATAGRIVNGMGEAPNELTVGRVAALAGVSVRTLHHYDAIGLVHPSGRTPAGYRVYADADVARLQQVLIYRRLGFTLEAIPALLDDPSVDAIGHLVRQRELLVERRAELAAMVAAIDAHINRRTEARDMGIQLSPEEQLAIFGTDEVGGEWADEAADRWGGTDAYAESQRRTSSYTKADWARMKTEADEGLAAFAEAFREGRSADGPRARQIAEDHRAHLSRWFYDCSHEMHRGLAEIYVSDPRFTSLYEDVVPGLAQYVRDAICANASPSELP